MRGNRGTGTNTPAVADQYPATAPLAVTSFGPVAPGIQERSGPMPGTVTGWQPNNPLATDNAQIGSFAGTVWTQYPANLPNVQRFCGVEGLRSAWYYPSVGGLPLGSSITQTVSPANAVGSQRFGVKYSGPIGPLLARTDKARVTDQAMRQSGARVVGWARSLWNGFTGNSADSPADQNTWPTRSVALRNTPLPVVALTPTVRPAIGANR